MFRAGSEGLQQLCMLSHLVGKIIIVWGLLISGNIYHIGLFNFFRDFDKNISEFNRSFVNCLEWLFTLLGV